MKFLKHNLNGIILCLFEAMVGILLLINPIGFTSGIIIVAGTVFVITGLISIIGYFKADALKAAVSRSLMKGLAALLAGAFCIFRSQWFIITFPVLTIIYGVAVLVTGLGKVQLTVDMLRLKNNKWFLAAISAAVSVIGAVVILSNPFASTAVLWMFTGISLIVEAIFDTIIMIVSGKAGKDVILTQ